MKFSERIDEILNEGMDPKDIVSGKVSQFLRAHKEDNWPIMTASANKLVDTIKKNKKKFDPDTIAELEKSTKTKGLAGIKKFATWYSKNK